MRRITWPLLTVIASLAACSNMTVGAGTPASTSERATDGTQNYESIAELHDAIVDSGVNCTGFAESGVIGRSTAVGTCDVAGGQLTLNLWPDAFTRDDATSNIIASIGGDTGYCWVLGRGEGDEGAWSVDASANTDACQALGDKLGGEIFDYEAPAAEPTTPAPTTPAPPPPAAPEQYSGSGASVVTLVATDPRIVTITHDGESNFAVWSVNAQGQDIDLLVNTIGSYSGVVPLNFLEGEDVAALKIEADGQWTVVSAPFTSAPAWDGAAPYSAQGAGVILVRGVAEGLTPVTFTHQGEGNFAVWAYGDSEDLLVNEIGAYSGETLLPEGTIVLVVEADGPWSIAKS
ncbi:hypothetical protein ACI8AF_14380 [Blastococcus sp. SYSU D00669]